MIKKLIKESVLEVGYAIYMSEVYKILMVRIFVKTDKMTKFPNVQAQNGSQSKGYNHFNMMFVRWSKVPRDETPYIITGNIKQTGLQERPKSIYVKIEILEQGKLTILKA